MNPSGYETRIYCPKCRVFHDARLEEFDNQMFWAVECPAAPRKVRISSDARLFRKFRAQARDPARIPVREWDPARCPWR